MNGSCFVPGYLLGGGSSSANVNAPKHRNSNSSFTIVPSNVFSEDEETQPMNDAETVLESMNYQSDCEVDDDIQLEPTCRDSSLLLTRANDHTTPMSHEELLEWVVYSQLNGGWDCAYDSYPIHKQFPDPAIDATAVIENVPITRLFEFYRKIELYDECYIFRGKLELSIPGQDETEIVSNCMIGLHKSYFENNRIYTSEAIMDELWRLSSSTWLDLKLFVDSTKNPPKYYLDPAADFPEEKKITFKKPSTVQWTSTQRRIQYSCINPNIPSIQDIRPWKLCWILSEPPKFPSQIKSQFLVKFAPVMLNPQIPTQAYGSICGTRQDHHIVYLIQIPTITGKRERPDSKVNSISVDADLEPNPKSKKYS